MAPGVLLLSTTTAFAAPPPHIFVHLADDAGWNDFGFTRGLLDEMVRKVRDSTMHQLELGLDDVAGRVARRLNELSDRFGVHQDDGSMAFKSPITQQELADWSGVSRQAVVKELARLRELGWLETKGSFMQIHNPRGIAERASQLSGL